MEFKLDRNTFKASNASEKIHYGKIYKHGSTAELLEIAAYLNSLAYGYSLDNPPRIDKTVFHVRAREK
ncbi:hypothetical protein [Aquiflexum lacus]|uniref:hypothetical protein n=1 Tax=Aquiflexum lacus TaxID=2483805 RepID=UPI001893B686|nr:hypothetical protein [Aquiflexum lacus]